MKKEKAVKKYFFLLLVASFFQLLGTQQARAAADDMGNFCSVPPFVSTGAKPNLLLMIDNSSSMYDLTYVDNGNAGTRAPYYCYDQTYSSANTYTGYFDKDRYYQYDFTNNFFYDIGTTFPVTIAGVSCNTNSSTVRYISGTLCITGTSLDAASAASAVIGFAAKGSYLNWLTASKFDIQKQILTGGKYLDKVCSGSSETGTVSCAVDANCPSGQTCSIDLVPNVLQAESRGCVGRAFVKEALTSDFVNYASPESNNPNTSLGITFSVNGPVDLTAPTAPSPGGQTYINILVGNYNQAVCQEAIKVLADSTSSNADIRQAVADCLSYSGSGSTCEDNGASCDRDSDCVVVPGGTCQGTVTLGSCSTSATGICTGNNGTCSLGKQCVGGTNNGSSCSNNNNCSGGTCSKICLGGGKAGSMCNNSGECQVKTCTSGRSGFCTVSSDCDIKKCADGVTSCTSDSDCSTLICSATSPIGRVGTSCSTNDDCNNFGPCVSPTATAAAKTKIVFNQSMQACWAYNKWVAGNGGADIGTDEINTVKNQCSDLYDENYICMGGDKDGLTCSSDANCPGGLCKKGPDAIRPGNASYICSRTFAGFCATSSDNWAHSAWIANGYSSVSDCVEQKHREFCNSAQATEVVDPTDDPSETSNYDNLPAIMTDVGAEAQLGQPVKKLRMRLRSDAVPENLIQKYEDGILMGAMTFNFNGSVSECGGTSDVPCPKVCSTDPTRVCGSYMDCPSPSSAICSVTATNFDGGKVISYIGGTCSGHSTVFCSDDVDCPSFNSGETCTISVGNHSSGLIKSIDDVKASSWTPFAEAFYEAIGYFARNTSTGKSRDFRLQTGTCSVSTNKICKVAGDCPSGESCTINQTTGDYNLSRNPSSAWCRSNNILLITDGMSTADRHSAIDGASGVATNYASAAGLAGQSGYDSAHSCPDFSGSRSLPVLSWVGRHADITSFLTTAATYSAPDKENESINTYVVYSGSGTSNPSLGLCDPITLMNKTAEKGGTNSATIATNPSELSAKLNQTLGSIAAKAASGSAVSVLTTSARGVGSMLQAYFYPTLNLANGKQIQWLGYTQNIWVDPSDLLRDDHSSTNIATPAPDSHLILNQDRVMKMSTDSTSNATKVGFFTTDENGSGGGLASCQTATVMDFNQVVPIWEGGKKLSEPHGPGLALHFYCKAGRSRHGSAGRHGVY